MRVGRHVTPRTSTTPLQFSARWGSSKGSPASIPTKVQTQALGTPAAVMHGKTCTGKHSAVLTVQYYCPTNCRHSTAYQRCNSRAQTAAFAPHQVLTMAIRGDVWFSYIF